MAGNIVGRGGDDRTLGTAPKPYSKAFISDLELNGHGYRSLLAAKEPGITYSKEDAYFQSAQVDFEPGRDVACVDFQYHSSGSTGNRFFWYTTGLNPSTASDGAWGLKFHGNNLTVFVRNNGGAAGEKRRIVISSGDLTAGDIYRIKFDLKTTDDYPDIYLNGSLLTLGAETTGGDQTNVSWATIAQTGGRFFFGDLSMSTTENSLKLLSLDLLYGGADLTSQEIANIESQGLPERFLRASDGGAFTIASNENGATNFDYSTFSSSGVDQISVTKTGDADAAFAFFLLTGDTKQMNNGTAVVVDATLTLNSGTAPNLRLRNFGTSFGSISTLSSGRGVYVLYSNQNTLTFERLEVRLAPGLSTDFDLTINSISFLGRAFDLRFGNLPQLTDISGNGNHALNIDGTPDNAEDITVQYSSDLVWSASNAGKIWNGTEAGYIPSGFRIKAIRFHADTGGYPLNIGPASDPDRYVDGFNVSAGWNVIELGSADLLESVSDSVNTDLVFDPDGTITETISNASIELIKA